MEYDEGKMFEQILQNQTEILNQQKLLLDMVYAIYMDKVGIAKPKGNKKGKKTVSETIEEEEDEIETEEDNKGIRNLTR